MTYDVAFPGRQDEHRCLLRICQWRRFASTALWVARNHEELVLD